MSLITRCPACETMFRVVPDQLRISEGWVRCGHCTEVFDAALHLQPQALTPEPPLEPAQPPVEAPVQAPVEPYSAPSSSPYSEPSVPPQPQPWMQAPESAPVSEPVAPVYAPTHAPTYAPTYAPSDAPGFAPPPAWPAPMSEPAFEPLSVSTPVPAPASFVDQSTDPYPASPLESASGAPAVAFDFLPAPASPLSFTPSYPAPEFESVSPAALAPTSLGWNAAPSGEVAPHSLAQDAGTVERAMAEMHQGALSQEVIAPPIVRESLPDDASSQTSSETPADTKDALADSSETTAAAAALAADPAPAAAVAKLGAVEEPTESTIEDMSFVRDARRKAFWRRPVVRVALVVVCVLLVAVLMLQVAVQERDRIAAIDPRAKPWLEELCGPLGCAVKPLRQIESIVIESSAFNKVRGNAYRFSVSLRNKSTVPLAMPGIELALTDSQDQPMLRRVLLPADLGAGAVLAPGAEWSASLPVSIAPTTQTARIAGYRLLAFYP